MAAYSITRVLWFVNVHFTGVRPLGYASPTQSASTAYAPIIVDNRDPGFSTVGDWYPAVTGLQFGQDCLWAHRGIQNSATFRPELPAAGVYAVAAWWCGDPIRDQTPQLHLEIHPTSGRVAPNVAVVNTQVNGGSWQSLGAALMAELPPP